jgi:hypothetical protein
MMNMDEEKILELEQMEEVSGGDLPGHGGAGGSLSGGGNVKKKLK